MSPPNVQIAFQGGGAKLLAMLPVAHAFQHCEQAGRIHIKALAGTSAGAICASLIAANCDFARLRTYLKASASKHVDGLANAQLDQLKALTSSQGLHRSLRFIKAASTLRSLYSEGKSILNEHEFSTFLDAILETCDHGTKDIESLPKNLTIIVTDLAKLVGEERKSGNLRQALRDTCALPVAFRSFLALTTNHYVDGGLCDNLPVQSLVADVSTPIFAVFPEETADPEPISDLSTYLLSLFSAAIENNVKRAKAIVSQPFQIPVRCSFSTFGFQEAIRLYNNDSWYSNIKDDTIAKINDFSMMYGRLDDSSQYRFDDTKKTGDYAETLERLTQDYAKHIEIKRTQFFARVNSPDLLVGQVRESRRPADGLTKIVTFVVKSSSFKYYRTTIGVGPEPSIWRAHNRTKGKNLPIKVLSLESTIGPRDTAKICLVEFPEASGIGVSDEIEIIDSSNRKDALKELNAGKRGYLRVSNVNDCVVPVVELVLKYPTSLGRFSLECDYGKTSVPQARIEYFYPDAELGDTNTSALGMRALDVPPGGSILCDIVPQ